MPFRQADDGVAAMASQDSDASELELAKEYSEVLAETDDEDDRILNALCARAKANQEYRIARGYYRGSSSCQSTPIRKRQADSPATTSDSGRRAARRSSSDAAASADGLGSFDLAVYNGSYLETEPDGSDRFCLLYTSPSPRDRTRSRMPSSA